MREDPIIPMGFAAMMIQGLVMSLALQAWRGPDATLANGFAVAIAFGLFLIAYIALAEPAKYATPDIIAWMRIEVIVGLVQFSVFGLVLGFIHFKLG